MKWRTSCVCNQTSKHDGAMVRSLDQLIFGGIPTTEIDHNIIWLENQRSNIERQISELESIKRDRERSKKWRDNMNAIAKQFYDDDVLHLDTDTRAKIIYQRLDCTWERACALAEMISVKVRKKLRKNRDENICYEYRNGVSAAKLSQKHDISRQQIHNIVRKDENCTKNFL